MAGSNYFRFGKKKTKGLVCCPCVKKENPCSICTVEPFPPSEWDVVIPNYPLAEPGLCTDVQCQAIGGTYRITQASDCLWNLTLPTVDCELRYIQFELLLGGINGPSGELQYILESTAGFLGDVTYFGFELHDFDNVSCRKTFSMQMFGSTAAPACVDVATLAQVIPV